LAQAKASLRLAQAKAALAQAKAAQAKATSLARGQAGSTKMNFERFARL